MTETTLEQIRQVLHAVAGVLVWPVIIGLIALGALMLLALGAFAREAWERWRRPAAATAMVLAALDAAAGAPPQEGLDLRLEAILQPDELRRWRSVKRMRLAVRVGPALGLMGTLIPMAHALQGLADGNLPSLASNLVTAFAATVIGLAISVAAYLVAAVREGWVRRDAQAVAFHAEALLRGPADAAGAGGAGGAGGARNAT